MKRTQTKRIWWSAFLSGEFAHRMTKNVYQQQIECFHNANWKVLLCFRNRATYWGACHMDTPPAATNAMRYNVVCFFKCWWVVSIYLNATANESQTTKSKKKELINWNSNEPLHLSSHSHQVNRVGPAWKRKWTFVKPQIDPVHSNQCRRRIKKLLQYVCVQYTQGCRCLRNWSFRRSCVWIPVDGFSENRLYFMAQA